MFSYKERGNDYFRAKEYVNSLKEYTRSIEIFPTSIAYNNRAMSSKILKIRLRYVMEWNLF